MQNSTAVMHGFRCYTLNNNKILIYIIDNILQLYFDQSFPNNNPMGKKGFTNTKYCIRNIAIINI